MGETEISAVGSHVCRVQPVDLLSSNSPQKGSLKSDTTIAENLPSPQPLGGNPHSDITKPEIYDANSPSSSYSDQQVVTLKSEACSPDSSPSPSPRPELITPPPTSHSGTSRSYDCTECGKKFSKPSKLKNHMHLHTGERPFACTHPGCDKAYTSSSHLHRHMKAHEEGHMKSPLQICLECKAMFRSSGGLQKHMKTIHMTENGYPYACSECGRAFRKKKLLTYHMHEHGGNPAFRCQHCDVQFTHKYLYNRHMRGHRTHPCRWPGCKLVLANWSLLRKHMALHNRGEYPVLPDESAAANETSDGAQPVQPIRIPGKKCPICDMVIRSRNRYYTHLEQHKDVLKCPHPSCDRAYTYKRNLDNHIRTRHTEESRFVCDICGRSLASKQKLKMHKINMHVNGPKPNVRKSVERAPRKDRGTIKRALAAKLAGIEIPYEEEKRLLLEDEEFRKGDPLITFNVVSSPESGFASLPGALRSNLSWSSDVGLSSGTEDGYRTGEPSDASDLQGPSETQRRDDDHQETSTDEELWYSEGESSDEESGSGHCEDDEGDDNDDHDEDEDEGGDDDDDDLNDEEEEDEEDNDEEGNDDEEEGGEERGSDNHLAQGESNNGKRTGSESLSRDEIQDRRGDFEVDRDSTEHNESNDNVESPEEFITRDLGSNESEPQRTLKRKRDDGDISSKRHRGQLERGDTAGSPARSPDVSMAEDCLVPDKKQLSRNVDTSIFEVNVAKEKASKRLPENVWVSTFQASIDYCLPIKKEKGDEDDSDTEHDC